MGRPLQHHDRDVLATIDSSILLISLPDISRSIHGNPLAPGTSTTCCNTNYLLWMILSFLVVTAGLAVNLGRLGDTYGRVRTSNLEYLRRSYGLDLEDPASNHLVVDGTALGMDAVAEMLLVVVGALSVSRMDTQSPG